MPGRSRTASRYESVATRRRPSPSAAMSTPVRIGRASSLRAAGTTWRRASASSDGVERDGVARRARRAGGTRRPGTPGRENCERPAVMRASSPSTSTSTAPGWQRLARRRTRAAPAGRPRRPRARTPSVIVTEIVSSRSLPVSAARRPASSTRIPGQHRQRTTAAGDGTSRRAERLDEDVTLASELHVALFLLSQGICIQRVVVVVGLWIVDDQASPQVTAQIRRPRAVPRLPQAQARARDAAGDDRRLCPPSRRCRPQVVHARVSTERRSRRRACASVDR